MTKPNNIQIQQIEEFRIDDNVREPLRQLLHACFPEYFATRIYHKQLPTFRLLAWDDSQLDGPKLIGPKLVGQCGIDHRVVAFDESATTIFGIVDLCVDETARGHGVGSQLITKAEQLAKANGIDCLLLFADDHRIYTKHGFINHECTVHWLGIDEHQSLGTNHKQMGDCLMIKPLADGVTAPDEIDMLGYLF